MIDIIPMVIKHEYLFAFKVALRKTIYKKLGLEGENFFKMCKEYAVDDPVTEKTRRSLKMKIEKLTKAWNILDQI